MKRKPITKEELDKKVKSFLSSDVNSEELKKQVEENMAKKKDIRKKIAEKLEISLEDLEFAL